MKHYLFKVIRPIPGPPEILQLPEGGGPVVPPEEITTFQDTFNRADQGPLGLGTSSDGTKTWALSPGLTNMEEPPAVDGGWGIISNTAGCDFLNGNIQTAVVTLVKSGRLTAEIGTAPIMGIPYYIIGRYVDNNNHVRIAISPGESEMRIEEIVASVVTVLHTSSLTLATGNTVGLELTDGNQAKMLKNGAVIATVATTAHLTATKWGIGVDGTGAEASPWDGRINQVDFTSDI